MVHFKLDATTRGLRRVGVGFCNSLSFPSGGILRDPIGA